MQITDCSCAGLEDIAVVDMVHDQAVFLSLTQVKQRQKPCISLYTCRECQQAWLVAADYHNDIDCFLRLDTETAERIVQANAWPTDFDRYETLLAIGRDAGHKVIYGPITDIPRSSLFHLTVRLATERPGICVSELASLLNLEPAVATQTAEVAVRNAEVMVTFD